MKRKPLILISLLLAAFVINLDTTIINIALPSLVRQLHASDSQLQWVVDAFNLLFAGSVLAAGSLSDRFGRKGMLLTGLTVFGLASLAGGLMNSPSALIATRSVMGVGAAMVFPSTLSLITNVFTQRDERARAIGLWGAITGVAIALGPIVGGWLLELSVFGNLRVRRAAVARLTCASAHPQRRRTGRSTSSLSVSQPAARISIPQRRPERRRAALIAALDHRGMRPHNGDRRELPPIAAQPSPGPRSTTTPATTPRVAAERVQRRLNVLLPQP